MGHFQLDKVLNRRMAGQSAVGFSEVKTRQFELRGQLVEVERIMQVSAHHRVHGVYIEHPPGLQGGPRRQHGQRGQ